MQGIHPALRQLLGLKSRAWIRNLKARLSTGRGLLFALVGVGVTVAWLGAVTLMGGAARPTPAEAVSTAQAMLLIFALILASSAVLHRGLYLPEEEVERLFSAPLRRSDLVRYRLLCAFGRELLIGLFLGVALGRRMQVPLFAFLGGIVALWALTCAAKALSIFLGDAAGRLAGWVDRIPRAWFRVLVGLGVWAVMLFFLLGESYEGTRSGASLGGAFRTLTEHPWVVAVSWPTLPWAHAIAAGDWGEFLPAIGLSLALTFVLFEFAARLPVDFRELSLATSSEISQRRARAGVGAAMATSKRRWAVPFVAGRGPLGAIVWMRLVTILRRSRGAIMFSMVVLGAGAWLVLTEFGSHGAGESALGGPTVFVLVGVLYLSSGLRFDLRSDLDRLGLIRSWPMPAPRIFWASIAPLVLFECCLIGLGLLFLGLHGNFDRSEWLACLGALPFLSGVWVGLENLFFLLAPVRYIPGQGGAMQNRGRRLIMLMTRMLVVGGLIGIAAALVWVMGRVAASLGMGPQAGTALAIVAAGAVGLAGLIGVVWIGGWALRRFDSTALSSRPD